MLDDKILIGRLKRGDQTALECIYLKYRPRLMATACSYHVDSHQAEDVLHDVFLSLTHRVCEFEIHHSLYGYLRTGIVNGIRDIVRRRSRRRLPIPCPESEEMWCPREILIQSEESERAENLLRVLPDVQREVVCLRIQEGLKFREIARVQGVSSNTVRGRYRYGISRLRGLSALSHCG